MSQYDLKIVGHIQESEYVKLKSYIDILCEDDKLTVIIEDSEENSTNEFLKILEQNDLIKVSEAVLVNDAYKMTYKRKK
jgi:hypothetical protein